MIFNNIVWNIDPEIFHLGPLSVRWYGLLFAMSFFMGYMIFQHFFKKENLKAELLDSLLIYMMVGVVLGARLGHCFFYDFDYYMSNPLEILMIWHGGLASHGAALGILIALWLWSRKEKMEFLWIIDRIVVTAALGAFFIRMGNLFNSEIYGVATDLPWGFIFVRNEEVLPKHPTQIYEALSYLSIFAILIFMYFKNIWFEQRGKIFGFFLITVFTARLLIEFIKNPQSDFESSMVLNMGQLLSLPFIAVGIWLMLRKNKNLGLTK